MKKRVNLAVLILSVLLVFLLSGLGGAAEKKVKIIVFNEWIGSHPFTPYFNKRLASFKAAHPNIDVQVDEIAGSSTANMDSKLKVQISAGELPDAFYTNDKSIIKLAKKQNLLYDFKPFLDKDRDLKSSLSANDLAMWNDGKAHVYGISSTEDFFGYFYNKELFKKVGYQKFPETWDQFNDACAKLKAIGIAPMSLETKTAWISSLTLFANLSASGPAGVKIANAIELKDYNSPEFIKAATALQNYFQKYSTVDAAGSDVSVAMNNFINGKTAMYLDGTWRIGQFRDEKQTPKGFAGKLGVALLPNKGIVSYPSFAWFSGSKSKAKAAAAYELVKWFSNTESQKDMLQMLGNMPVSPKINVSTLKIDPLMADYFKLKPEVKYRVISPWRIYFASVTAIIPQELSALATGQITPAKFAQDLSNAAKQ
jgi:raffinose/stachyose/melibiose transport system substrate-binding protein